MSTYNLKLTKVIPGPQEEVFNAWLDPEVLAAFMCPGNVQCTRVDVDPRVEGEFLILMVAGGKELPHTGHYKVIERHHRLAFTWCSNNSGTDSLVTLTFEENGPKETALTLHHVGLPTQESKDAHLGGWGSILELLRLAAC